MGRKIRDLTGEKFGKLTVLALSPDRHSINGNAQWLCRCECGNIVEVVNTSLLAGTTASCGCLRREGMARLTTKPAIDIRGKRFGRLTAIKPTYIRDINGSVVWKCKCDCGNIKFVTLPNLKNGSTKSCGCLKKEKIRRAVLDF